MSSDAEDIGGVSGVLAESDVEEARISDYVLFIAAAAISIALIGFAAVELARTF
ncbi:hypothetical protein [Parvibaculum sp.]|uniref:hypothetical protein n=1 Tax=Parvibaculum sp. TaxID=2024848 RepID=UPI002D8000D5|nr:hypothetical protein [Parvibaculum sp.]